MLQWTGERYVPWMEEGEIHYEHLHRYGFGKEFVRGRKVLDLACGEGYGSFMLAEEANEVVGIDIDETTITHASSKYIRENLAFMKGSITDVPIKGEKIFDVIVCFEALEHIEEHHKLMEEVKRLLKADGIFIVSTPNKYMYSDQPNYQNPFHLKELYLGEFKELLSMYFKNIRTYGQKVYPSSNIFPLHIESRPSKDLVIAKGDKEFVFLPPEKKLARYFISVASDSRLKKADLIGDSHLIDISETLFRQKDVHITHLEGIVKEKEAEMENFTKAISQRDSRVSELTSALSEKDSNILSLRGAVSEKDGEIGNLKETINQRATQISQLEGVVRERETVLDRLRIDLAERERREESLQETMNQKTAQISQLEGVVSQKDGEIGNLQGAIDQKTSQISQLEGVVRERETVLDRLKIDLGGKEREIKSFNEAVTQRDGQISHLVAKVKEKEDEIRNLKEAINYRATRISYLDSANTEKEAALNHIYHSHGWKTLSAYYKVRDRVLPAGTRRRRFAVSIFKFLLRVPQISGKVNVIGPAPSRPKDSCPATPAEGLGEEGTDQTHMACSVPSTASLPIAQSSPFLKKPATTRKRILLVSYYCPVRSHAGGLRILDIYRLIKLKYPDVELDLYTCRRPEIDGSYKDLEDIYDNIYYSTTDELTVSDLLNQCRIRPSYDVIDLQFHQSARHIDEFRTLGSKILFTPMESLARSQFIRAQETFRRRHALSMKPVLAGIKEATQELKICRKADEVICVSRSDAAFLRAMSLSKKIKALETGISNIEFQDTLDHLSSELTPENKENAILYLAYFGSETNIVALRWYLENVHPLIKSRVPDYRLRVVGRGDLSVFSKYREDSIDFVGPVVSIGPYIDKAKVGIAPALGGAGFRGKINQYAIFGVPSVVSPIAAKGLVYENEADIFIVEKPEDFAERCILLLLDNEVNKKIGHKARQTAYLNYSWKSKLDVIEKIYGLESDILMNRPKVTALVPSFNHGRYLRQRIESILQQTYPNVELIVIDDCSEDESDDVIRSLQAQYGFKFIRNARNSGTPFAAWERLLSLGTGEYIWVCESDDYADPRFLEVTVDALMHNKDAALAYCDSWIVDEQGRKVDHTDTYFHEIWRESRWDRDFVRTGASELNDFQLRGQTVPNMSSALFTSRAFKQAYHSFLKNFKLTGDWLFVGRILRYGSVVFCKQTLNYFRRHEVTSRVRVKSARSQAEFILTKYILFRATERPLREFASVMSPDAVRFLYEPAGIFEMLQAFLHISASKTLQCGMSLAASLAMNGHFVKKFIQRYKLVRGCK